MALPVLSAGRAESRAFVRALREFGFLYLRDHGVPRDVSATALREARRLFDKVPAADKAAVALDGRRTAFRGFQALEQNVTGGVRDQHEALDVMREPWAGAPASPVLGPNLWPPSQPSLRPALEDYFRHMLRVGHDVMATIAHGLESEPGAPQLDARRWADPFWIARAIHYPRAATPRQQGCGEHTDYGLLTMILQEDVAGCLEIRHKGRLMPVAPMQDCLVINIGDVLSAWTGGYFVATPHLVHSPLNSSRVSLPFFFEPDFNAVIKADGTTYARHLEQKCLQNFSY